MINHTTILFAVIALVMFVSVLKQMLATRKATVKRNYTEIYDEY